MAVRKHPFASTHYLNMTRAQAAAALQEFLDERAPALVRLRAALAEDGPRPETLLDGSIESLTPLWQWLLSRFTLRDAPGATDPASVSREAWPSWERHTYEEELTLSFESLVLLDGLVSYLADVVLAQALEARWEAARHPIKRYAYNNHPVLVSGAGEIHNFLPGFPDASARGALKGFRESPDDTMAVHARQLIESLNRVEVEPAEEAKPEPLFEVVDTSDEPGGYNLEIDLGEEIAHERSRKVERWVRELAREADVYEAIREDREIILVRAPSWTVAQLEAWVSQRI